MSRFFLHFYGWKGTWNFLLNLWKILENDTNGIVEWWKRYFKWLMKFFNWIVLWFDGFSGGEGYNIGNFNGVRISFWLGLVLFWFGIVILHFCEAKVLDEVGRSLVVIVRKTFFALLHAILCMLWKFLEITQAGYLETISPQTLNPLQNSVWLEEDARR